MVKHLTESQIMSLLKEAQAGGMETPDTHRIKALEEENQRLKQLCADLMLSLSNQTQ